MINKIIEYFRSKATLTGIELDKVKKALPKIDRKILNPARHFVLDTKYKSCSLTDMQKILFKDLTNFKLSGKYYDCDNYAFRLSAKVKSKYPSLSFGVVLSTSHAFNIFIDKYGKVWYIEPQTDKIFSKLTKEYKPILLIIL